MTVRAMSTDDQIAELAAMRDQMDSEEFYWFRNASSDRARTLAKLLAEWREVTDDVISNLRLERQRQRREDGAE